MEENFDTHNLFTPVNAQHLKKLLTDTNYNKEKTDKLIKGFEDGFDIGYRGSENVQMQSPNLKLTIGSTTELWNKVMKEVKELRYAGPFKQIPFKNYIQSPIGLVPKDGGKKTRLIFHLSYPRNSGKSVNENTPPDLTQVSYPSFDDAVWLCIQAGKNCAAGKSDMTSAFRHLCIRKEDWKYLVMKAKCPIDNKFYYFFDKCLPFGASISCKHFQDFSDAVAHIVKCKTKAENINYLDDFFFVALFKSICDKQIQTFLDTCEFINFPVSMEKTFWGTTRLTFLGLVIDTRLQLVCVPKEKIERAINAIMEMLNKKSKKTTLKKLQQLCGFLNFIGKSIVPGRAFTRRLYTFGEKTLKDYHHLPIKQEMKLDLTMWLSFLNHPAAHSRSFFEFDKNYSAEEIDMYTDASTLFGCGGHNDNEWFVGAWQEEQEFMDKTQPSINYLELYAVTVAIILWIHKYQNKKITLFCDNMSVVHMINNNSSKCKNCMVLIRMLVLHSMTNNVKVMAKHVTGVTNIFADRISRLQYKEFRQLSKETQ